MLLFLLIAGVASVVLTLLWMLFWHKVIVPYTKVYKWKSDDEKKAYEKANKILKGEKNGRKD